ncbi:hypothetical protein [Flavobacterium sp. 14A]|uniref:hypothetical protein n=1 Tax=Flavobacterium sp. 14A TaxID=2735896 RepID=UPI001570F4BC|nr:hypothetical protein [Flavobacterium sp. 14A]NRT11505.1 hypothetical protein [Flavobacterium sp. 14A]
MEFQITQNFGEITPVKTIRERVKASQAFRTINSAQKNIINSSQNIRAIRKGFLRLKTLGIVEWEKAFKGSNTNAEIIRELYINSLIIK